MSNKRIDLGAIETEFKESISCPGCENWELWFRIPALVHELKRCYEQIDDFVDMLHKLGYYGENISEAKQLEWDEASE